MGTMQGAGDKDYVAAGQRISQEVVIKVIIEDRTKNKKISVKKDRK